MKSQNVLRFKVATSFAISVLGTVMFARIATSESLSLETLVPLATSLLFVIAGGWRGYLYVQALKSAVKP